jgi:ABC-type nitrate/sulfonate/bicarbonate transport system substrate-binding protein
MSNQQQLPDNTLWFTRCAGNGQGGVPTASGIAFNLGWLQDEFTSDNIRLRALQDDDSADFRHHHYDHGLQTLIREGGNLFAIPAKAQGADTVLIGLTWIEESQSIIVRPDSNIRKPEDLKGKRLALPGYNPKDITENKRGRTITRHSSLHGYKGVLASVGLTLDDIHLVEVGQNEVTTDGRRYGGWQASFNALLAGKVDAIYVKGAAAQDGARDQGLVVGIDLDTLPEKRFRVNNGTPRPVTVHRYLLDNHYDVVVRFLTQTLRAAEWAKTNLAGVHEILQNETGGTAEGVAAAYRNGFHLSLAPDLSAERLELFRQQKDFLLSYGILDKDFDFDAWVDHRPIQDAQKALQQLLANEQGGKLAA